MKKKKIIIAILIMTLLCIILFICLTLRKVTIMRNISKIASKYNNYENYYEKITNTTQKITTEYYKNGDQTKTIMNRDAGENSTTITYFNKNGKNNSYYEPVNGQKKARLNNEGAMLQTNIIVLTFGDNFGYDFYSATKTIIKNTILNGKECYLFKDIVYGNYMYIEKDTGLILKMQDGYISDENNKDTPIIVEYEYKFDTVTDNDFIEPDISQYKVEEDN